MAYKFKYNERPRSYSEEKHGDEDIPSAKAVRDTAVEERDDKIIKSRRQHVCGRDMPYLFVKSSVALNLS